MISGNYYLHTLISNDIKNKSKDNKNGKNNIKENNIKENNIKENNIKENKVTIKRSISSPRMLRNKSMDNFFKFQWPWII